MKQLNIDCIMIGGCFKMIIIILARIKEHFSRGHSFPVGMLKRWFLETHLEYFFPNNIAKNKQHFLNNNNKKIKIPDDALSYPAFWFLNYTIEKS